MIPHRSTSQTITWPPSPAAAASDPSAEKATLLSFPTPQVYVRATASVSASNTFTVVSLLVAARYFPDGWNANPVKCFRLSFLARTGSPFRDAGQTNRFAPARPATTAPSGDTATESTLPFGQTADATTRSPGHFRTRTSGSWALRKEPAGSTGR